jgi:hypothetical protein
LQHELIRHVEDDGAMSSFDVGLQFLDISTMTHGGRRRDASFWIENASIEWNERQTQFHTVARLTLLPKSQLSPQESAETYFDVTGNATSRFSSVTDPLTVHVGTSRFYGLGRAVAATALNIPARGDFVRMVRPCGMGLPGIFVVACRSVGADAAGSVRGRSALGGVCLLRSQEQKHSDDEAGHDLTFQSRLAMNGTFKARKSGH